MAWRRIDVHRATERGDVAVLKRYLDSGGDAEKKDKEYGAAPAHWAALRGRLEALSLLLERGGNLESRTGTDGTPLVWGCMGGNAPVVRYLLERGANISAITKGKGTALHHATHSGYPEVVSLLLEKGANPKAQDNRGERPGDKFDPEVSDSNRRTIAKALAKAARGSSTSKRGPSSRSKRHPTDEKREGQPSSSSSLARSKPRAAPDDSYQSSTRVNGNDNHEDGGGGGGGGDDVGMNGHHPQSEDEALSAAAAAVAAAAWTPKSPSKRPRPMTIPEEPPPPPRTDAAKADGAGRGWGSSGGGVFASVDRNVSASQQPGAADVDARTSRRGTATGGGGGGSGGSGSNHYREDENGGRFWPSSPRANGDDRGPATVSPEPSSFLGLDDLRRRVKNLTLAAARAEDRDSESRASVRQALAEADERAQAAGAAERARSEMLGALVQALEERLRDKEDQVDKLTAELEDSNSRLWSTEQKVLDLRKRVEDPLRCDTRGGETTAAEAAAAAPQPTASRADGAPEDESSSAPPLAAGGERQGHDRGAPDRRACLRTRSSPTLSPTSDAAGTSARFLRAAGLQQEAGEDWPASRAGREPLDPAGEISPPGGVGGGSRRSTIGPGTISADDSFGYALESLAARDGGAGRGGGGVGALQAGVLGWWRRGEWREGNAEAAKSQPLHPPAAPAAVVEDQESLGSLYSMIARR